MMNKPKGTKPNEGYPLESTKGPSKPVSKPTNQVSGSGSTYGASTAKMSALGQEIDVVRTNNGHYVSRKMIEQLRAQQMANQQKQAPAPVPTPAKVVTEAPQQQIYTNSAREANTKYISARSKPGGFDGDYLPQPVKNPKVQPSGDTYGQPPDQYLDSGFYNADIYFQGLPSKQPRKDGDFHQRPGNKMRDEPFQETNEYYSRPSYDRGSDNADPYTQPEDFSQDNLSKAPKKKAAKDKDQTKANKQKVQNSEQTGREPKRGLQDLQNEQTVKEPNQDFYDSYGVDNSQYGQQTRYGQESSSYFNGQPIDDQSYYPEHQQQYVQDQYPQHDFNNTAHQFKKTEIPSNDRTSNPKAEKKQLFANKNPTIKDQIASTFTQSPDDYQAKQNFLEKNTKRMDLHRPPGPSNINNLAGQQPYLQKSMGGPLSMGPKSLNVNSPPVDFEIMGKNVHTDSNSFFPSDPRELPSQDQVYQRGQGQGAVSKEQVNLQQQLALSKDDSRDTNLLADISSIVKCIKRYENSCKELEQVYLKQGVDLRTQLNYDYATFSRNCLNIIRSLLNEVNPKDRPKEKDVQIKKQMEKLKISIDQNQAQINYLMPFANQNNMEMTPGAFVSKEPGDSFNDVVQISSIIPASISNSLAMNYPVQLRPPNMMGPHAGLITIAGVQLGSAYPGPVPVPQIHSVVQSELIRKNLQSGAYGSFIVNPYLQQQQAQAAPSYGYLSQPMANQTTTTLNQYNNDFSYGGLYAPQAQVQPEVYDTLPVANTMPMHMDPYGTQPNQGYMPSSEDYVYTEVSQFHGASMPMIASATHPTTENFMAEVADTHLEIEESQPSDLVYPQHGSDLRLYGVGGGLFGAFSKANTKAVPQTTGPATENKGETTPQENFKSLFSLFTQPAKAAPVFARLGASQEDDESSSHSNLKLYSDEDEAEAEDSNDQPADSIPTEQADQHPQSLERLLDEDSGGDAKSDSKKQDHHLPIDDISEIIPTESRFMQDSHFNDGKDFTLVDDGKPEDAQLNSERCSNHQFYKNGGTNQESLAQSRKESQDEQINLLDANVGKDQKGTADPQPRAIIAEDLSASKESLDRPSQRKARSSNQKSNLEIPRKVGEQSSSSKHDLVRDEQPNTVQGILDQEQLISETNLEQDFPVPFESENIITYQQTVPDFALNKTSTATPITFGATHERISDGQIPISHEQKSISSQQVTLAQQGVAVDKTPVCSTSNNIKSKLDLKGEFSLGQNRDLRVTEDQDLAVPTGDYFQAVARAGDQNPDKRLSKKGKPIKDTSALALSEGKDSLGASSDLKREPPREAMPTTFLNDQQVMRLIGIGKRASNKISVLVSKILDGYADSKSRRKDKRSEDCFFTESENPHGLNIFELCTSSEYSACVQRKLSRLKETERIELFYLMKPHLIRLLTDGLGKYVVHGMMSISKLL